MSDPLILLLTSFRFFLRHPAQLALTLVGIGLGAAAIIAVAIANRAAAVSFDRSLDALAGPVTHEVRAVNGPTLDEGLYPRLRTVPGVRAAVPVLEIPLILASSRVTLAGLDPLAMSGAPAAGPMLEAELVDILSTPGGVFLPARLARQLGVSAGDPVAARIGDRPVTLHVLGIFEPKDGGALEGRVLADIAVVQDLAAARGRLSSVQLQLDPGVTACVEKLLPSVVELVSREQQRADFAAMTRAFRTNLTAMSLLAILVGAFLVYNAMTFAVVQRSAMFGTLRMVGVTGRQLFRGLLIEASVLGALGAAFGIALGVALSQSLLLLVARTVSDLYIEIDPLNPGVSALELATGALVTVAAVLLATLPPAREAAASAPAGLGHALREVRGGGRLAAGSGVALILACPGLLLFAGESLLMAFVALFLLIAGFGLVTPFLLRGVLRLLEYLVHARLGTLAQLALRGVTRALPRLGPAVVALAIAVAATVGVATMIGSFRASVDSWLGATLQGDLYVYPQQGGQLAEAWPLAVRKLEGVEATTVLRSDELMVNGERLRALLLDEQVGAGRGFTLIEGREDAVQRVLGSGEGLLLSEPLANRWHLEPGASVTLATPDGDLALPVLGVYRDYGNSRGAVVLSYARYRAFRGPVAPTSLAVRLEGPASEDTVRAALRELTGRFGQAVDIVAPGAIRERSLAIFDRTFAITDVLRLLVILVAFVGIVSALLALFLERRREFALLRATGMTPQQLQWLVVGQAGLTGLGAGLLSLPLGMALAILLIDVINRRSFGWTMETHLDPGVFWQAPLLAVVAAVIAAWWPARRVAAGALREALETP